MQQVKHEGNPFDCSRGGKKGGKKRKFALRVQLSAGYMRLCFWRLKCGECTRIFRNNRESTVVNDIK